MNPFEIKVLMLQNGWTIASMAREICKESDAKESSMQVMISDLIYRRRFYPGLAQKLNNKFGILIERPEQFESAHTVVQKAA
ncbi:MAG TPA: hypothetical protein PKY59_07595 [Pyrinomonadaceae bacterium]|nr:hypothetical protein [Pyrinomonadaceae bacterium]